MTVKFIGNIASKWQGLKSDTKPTGDVPPNSIFNELDTGDRYIADTAGNWHNTRSVQYPTASDGDSIYAKDINLDLSSVGAFTGAAYSLFDDYQSEIVDSTATNPKTIILRFNRPVKSNGIAMASRSGDFSNVKIELKDLAGNVRTVIDDSANSTKVTSFLYQFTTDIFIEVSIEFHTADTVTLAGMYIPKVQSRAISAIDGYVSETNTTLAQLNAGVAFTGGQVDTLNYGMAVVAVYSDVDSAIDGLAIQFRSTSTSTWRDSDNFTILAGKEKTFSIQTVRRFMRIVYTNGGTNQGAFDLQTTLKPVYVKPSSHRVQDDVSGQDDAELAITVLKAKVPAGNYPSIEATASHNLKIANAEDAINIAQGNVVGKTTEHKFGRGSNIDSADGYVVLWDGAQYNNALKTYTYSATADIDRLSSDNNSDTVEIEVKGLDVNGDLVTQTKTLTGQTPVALDTPLWRVFRLKNIGATDLAGNTFCFVNVATTAGVPNTLTNTRAMIQGSNNQTLMALYTVPNGTTGLMLDWYGALSSAKASSFNNLELRARAEGGVFQLKHTSTLSSSGNSYINHTFIVPPIFPAKTDFVMLSDSSVNDNAVSAGFDFILVDD